jgi:hypothetical protein
VLKIVYFCAPIDGGGKIEAKILKIPAIDLNKLPKENKHHGANN